MADKPSPTIESKSQLIEAISRGNKPKSDWRIGTEHEKFTFYRDDHRPVPYEGENGIGALLDKVQAETAWLPYYDRDKVIGLNNPLGGGAISLEPGGQFELSGAPLETIHQTCTEANEHLKLLRKFTEPMGIDFLGIGVTPTWTLGDIPLMPKSRYGIMKPYMEKVGTLGTSMMFRSATVQVNLDFASEADMVRKMRVSLALQPVATALFANSPFLDGKPNGLLSFRSHIWLNTDKDRTGMLPFAFEDGMSFERYVDYALDVPMYFVIRNGEYINCAGESFRAFLDGKLPQLPGELPTARDWEDHLSTLFPEVRMKQFLEMRGADGAPWQGICALPAFWVGLLYDETALDAAWDLVKDWTEEERQALRNDVPRLALKTPFRNGTLFDIAKQALAIARSGLKARNKLNWEGADETVFLKPLDYTIETGKTPAERLLDLYHGEWSGDLNRVFSDYGMARHAA
ncbi:glutamate--cysteine ligase [Pelagibacterium halotolerans]|uniref:Glutamate--cysteine ligase n=1 Tax=Pelagibacterium halotolerans (strain DSM 22347 / JCM 15775 / CGMCC 1.7692 / B2) TaxID=1082931 RepID=G4RB19_PELHB|nr:glutamate--cysteine ligase [Pelagibacterium halotolerans]AEQ50528.1 glutamate--cysteine ligase [Pelagibacterium halotolerans B2]QJR19521.1 glutamate--cysteine ligase [Pelagibacterium halotolerans]SDZ89056.1 glutamate--cysteine ligase [Pelagibacterium halotolerans]